MALPVYLAITAAEMAQNQQPSNCAWMACHFSPYGLGLSNFPKALPEGSLLILNDRTPVQLHSPDMVAAQLEELAEQFRASGVLLDFQRQWNPQTAAIVCAVTETLRIPTAVTEGYARELKSPVFLEAPRAYHPLEARAGQWKGREIWLEASFSPGTVTVTKDGSRYAPGCEFPEALPLQQDEKLFCHYCIEKSEQEVLFHLRRTLEDLLALLDKAEALGITRAIGLYQELGDAFLQK